jgi:hypothetical protein
MRRWALAAALCAVIIGWAAYDLWWPRRGDLRLFDPPEVARLETSMWRAYYDREFLGLYNDLAKLVRQQYRMPWLRSQVTAWHAARAAFLFERGKARADYERALPGLRSFYGAIRRTSVTGFDADRAARSELEWWIAHRARSGELERWLAEVQSCIYGLPAAAFAAHAKSRAEAMRLRDAAAATGRVTDREWARIEALLQDSWAALKTAVAAPRTGAQLAGVP